MRRLGMRDRRAFRRVVLMLVLLWSAPLQAADVEAVPASVGPATLEAEVLPPLAERFSDDQVDELPDFQRHVGPLLGHLGCNGRACHGSFQGRGGFMLSLFGYDFQADHAAISAADSGRVDLDDVEESLILFKPIDEDRHEGGKRMDADSWPYRVLRRWIEGGAKFGGETQQLERLEVTPREVVFGEQGQQAALRVIAHWADGTREDVTQLCRFTSNDDAVAAISSAGVVSAGDVGDTDVVIAYDAAVESVPVMRPAGGEIGDLPRPPQSDHPVDLLIAEKLDKLRIIPSQLCSDEDYIRRVSLDLAGILPSAERVERFLADPSPHKRAELIDELLADPAYAAWWATRFSDWTGNNEATLNNYLPVRGLASKLWFGWLAKRLAENMPYDQIIEGIVTAQSRMPEESFLEYCQTMSQICSSGDIEAYAQRPGLPMFWARSNFRSTEERAIGFAYSFLGVRIECAQCHKHPFDVWSKQDFDQFAVLFSPIRATPNSYAPQSQRQMRRLVNSLTDGERLRGGELRRRLTAALRQGEVVPFPELVVSQSDPRRPQRRRGNRSSVRRGRVLGEADMVAIQGDPRETLMQWLRSPENPYFAKAIVNRVWANHFGVGIVDPVDDLNLGNPPSNERLLDHLAGGFIDSGFDLQWLHRQILSSHAYQRSSVANVTNIQDTRNFSRHVPRRLPAEVLRDAIVLVTAGSQTAARARRQLDGLAISGQLVTQRRGRGDFALQVFGQSTRQSNCDCDRSDDANLLQSLYLQNDIDIHQALAQRDGWVAEVTRQWPGAERAQSGRRGRAVAVDRQMRRQVERRFDALVELPPQRRQPMRQRIREELQRMNQRRRQIGLEPLTFAELIRQAQSRAGQDDAAASGEVPGAAAKPELEPETETLDSETLQQAIRAAYLRALSRAPDADELAASSEYITQSETPVDGFRSVVWALLNTKEFMLTH